MKHEVTVTWIPNTARDKSVKMSPNALSFDVLRTTNLRFFGLRFSSFLALLFLGFISQGKRWWADGDGGARLEFCKILVEYPEMIERQSSSILTELLHFWIWPVYTLNNRPSKQRIIYDYMQLLPVAKLLFGTWHRKFLLKLLMYGRLDNWFYPYIIANQAYMSLTSYLECHLGYPGLLPSFCGYRSMCQFYQYSCFV